MTLLSVTYILTTREDKKANAILGKRDEFGIFRQTLCEN